MEKQSKEIIWTSRAVKDLKKVYNFNIKLQGEEKAFDLILSIISYPDILTDTKFTDIGSVDEDFKHLKRDYRKLIKGKHKITYRESSDKLKIYINRIFDTRQDSKKNR